MAAKKRKPAANEVIQSVETLFESRSVAEIREVEVKTRRDVEEKKLQLRQLVGDSYRDLLESADKIVGISKNCERIVANIQSMQESMSGLIHNISASNHSFTDKNDPLLKHEELYAVGGRVKYLVDTPEMIWGCLDLQQYLGAARRYLRAQEVHSLLNSSFPPEMLARFPLLAHQWPQVRKFKQQIVHAVKHSLTAAQDLGTKQVADALLAVAVLEAHDSHAVLQLMLDSRRAAVVQQLAHGSRQADGVPASKLLAGAAAMLQTCIYQVGELFLSSSKGAEASCLLQRTAHEDEVDASELIFEGHSSGSGEGRSQEVEAWLRSNQAVHDRLQPLTSGQVEKACSQWMRELESDCGSLCVQLLGTCQDAASLVETERSVRSAIQAWQRPVAEQQQTLTSRPSQRRRGESSAPSGNGWEGVGESVLGRPLLLWQDLFQLPFTTRAKQIIEAGFAAVRDGLAGPLDACLAGAAAATPEGPGCVSCPRWPQDLAFSSRPPTSLGEPSGASQPTTSQPSASREAAGSFRLSVQSIRRQFDQELTHVLTSVVLLLTDPGPVTEGPERGLSRHSSFAVTGGSFGMGPGGAGPRRDAVRAAELEPFVQQKCGEVVGQVAARLQSRLSAVTQPSPAAGTAGAAAVEAALLVGRLSSLLATESQALPLIMGPPEAWRSAGQPSSGASRMLAAASGYSRARPVASSAGSARLLQLTESLRGIAVQAYRVWSSWAASGLAANMAAALAADEVLRFPSTPVSWQETVVAAPAGDLEGDDALGGGGGNVEMRFMLPASPSPAISQFLAAACSEVRRAGDHTCGVDALQLLAWELAGSAVQALEGLLAPGSALDGRMSDKGVLQLLFDQRMLRDTLAGGRPLPARGTDDPAARASTADAAQADVAALSAERRRAWLSLQSNLTERLDPIDWATYEPHLWAHVARCCQRGATLLGLLMQLQRPAEPSGRLAPAAGTVEGRPLNVMPVVPRFQYLPVSTPLQSHGAAQRPRNAALPGTAVASSKGSTASDLASSYSFADLGSSNAGLQAAWQATEAAGPSGSEATTSALGALQARLGAGSLGSLGTMLGDKAAEMTAMAQQKFGDIGLSELGTGLFSSLAKNVGVRNPMQK